MYDKNSEYITLDKSLFHTDLLWSTRDKCRIKISKLISIYMNRPSQINTDILCGMFGSERVKETIKKNIQFKSTCTEALSQVEYYELKKSNKVYIATEKELDEILTNPNQRVIDYYCNNFSKDELLDKASKLKPKYPLYARIKIMINYLEFEKGQNKCL